MKSDQITNKNISIANLLIGVLSIVVIVFLVLTSFIQLFGVGIMSGCNDDLEAAAVSKLVFCFLLIPGSILSLMNIHLTSKIYQIISLIVNIFAFFVLFLLSIYQKTSLSLICSYDGGGSPTLFNDNIIISFYGLIIGLIGLFIFIINYKKYEK